MVRTTLAVAVVVALAGCQPRANDGSEGAARVAGDAVQSAGAVAVGDAGPPAALTWIAVRDINGVFDNDMNPTDRPPLTTEPPEGMIRSVDLNNDGDPDWRMDYADAGSPQWCGTGGCRQRLFVSTSEGLVQVFDANAFDIQIPAPGRVRAQVHHIYCAETDGLDDCVVELRLNGTTLSPVDADSEFRVLPEPAAEQ